MVHRLFTDLWYLAPPQAAWYGVQTGKWSTTSKSHLKQAHKAFTALVNHGQIERVANCYRLKGKTGKGSEHTLAVTEELLHILVDHPQAQIIREPSLIGRRPDAAVFTGHQFYFLEVAIQETSDQIRAKVRDYAHHGKEVREWFAQTYALNPPNFCFHLCFVTTQPIPEGKGVIVRCPHSTSPARPTTP